MADDLLTPAEAADLLRTSERTLARWREQRIGPPFIQVGRYIRYRRSAVLKWLEAQEQDRKCED